MPATPKHTLIRNAVVARLQTIAAGEVYHTDIGLRIFTWRPLTNPFGDKEIPGANVRDNQEPLLQQVLAGADNLWDRQAEFLIDIVASTPEEYDQAIADLEECFRADHTLGGLAIDINSGGWLADVDQEELKILRVTYRLLVHYRTDRFSAILS